MFLLTDDYPPFSLEDVDYPVRTILPAGGPLNRVSVFFRIILAIPAFVFAQIVERARGPAALRDVDRRHRHRQHAPVALRHLLVAAALPGPLPLVVQHGHVGVRVGHAGRLRPATPASSTAAARGGRGSDAGRAAPAAPAAAGAPGRPPASRRPSLRRNRSPTRRAGEQVPTPPPDPVPPPRRRGGRHPSRPLRPEAPRAPCPRPHRGSARPIPSSVEPLPSWGILILQGAARSWMIFAIVWGSIVFIGENVFRGHGHHNNTRPTG